MGHISPKEHPLKTGETGLAVFATNARAIGLYRKLGFVEEGRRPREVKFGADQYVDDILMYRFVKATVAATSVH
jgi:RimJ/RimL family protein N-acetyltransferase